MFAVSLTSMIRRAGTVLAAAAMVAGVAACGDDDEPGGPSGSVAGTYKLTTADGAVPPYFWDCGTTAVTMCTNSSPDFQRLDEVTMTLSGSATSGTLGASFKFTDREGGATPIVTTLPATGTYTVSGSTVNLTINIPGFGSETVAATRNGNELRFAFDLDSDAGNDNVVFTKQ